MSCQNLKISEKTRLDLLRDFRWIRSLEEKMSGSIEIMLGSEVLPRYFHLFCRLLRVE